MNRSETINTPFERDIEQDAATGQDETVADVPQRENEEGHGDGAVSDLSDDTQAEMDRLRAEVAENRENYQRALADLANYRRRKEQETGRLVEQARAETIRKFLPVVDDLDRALEAAETDEHVASWVEGFRLITQKLWATLESEGVRPMESVGQPFDPNLHDALFADADAEVKDTVVEEYERGYFIHDQVLRPAKVKVGSAEAFQPTDD